MSDGDVTTGGETPEAAPPPSLSPKRRKSDRALSWPPPGMEWIQGKLWRVTTLAWIGSLLMVLPLLWSLGVEPEFWSLGPFEGNWEIGLAVALVGAAILLGSFFLLYVIARRAGRGADRGYGFLTIAEAASDLSRDTGFLLQGHRHFGRFSASERSKLVRNRLWAGVLLLLGPVWLASGFSLSVILAARGLLSPRDTWVLTLLPSLIFLVWGGGLYLKQSIQGRVARRAWVLEEGGEDRVRGEVGVWTSLLEKEDQAGVMDPGSLDQGGRFRNAAVLVVLVFLIVFVPTITVAFSAAVGPILAEIALPQFLSVQEMAGAAEALRRYRLEPVSGSAAVEVGQALHALEFVGSDAGQNESFELPPARTYAEPWFPNADVFPDIFTEGVARELVLGAREGFSSEERAAIRQAAAHPAQAEFEVLAVADRVDMVTTRWETPFADSLTVLSLPWTRFMELRYAALAHVALAVEEQMAGRSADAETTVREVISTGFLLLEHGPTLLDNLMGVVIAGYGGDALEGLYELQGREDDLQTLHWARESAADAARAARLGMTGDDIHTLLQGIPDIVVNDDALRGLRWEFFATFNLLSPCINLHKMVFGPEESYEEWLDEARRSLVRVPGEAPLFDLATTEVSPFERPTGIIPSLVALTLGGGTRPGSCVNIIWAIQKGAVIG